MRISPIIQRVLQDNKTIKIANCETYSWDCASEEEEYFIHAAHSQHVERASEFLVSRMKVATSKSEVERQRIFFVSSKEVILNAFSKCCLAERFCLQVIEAKSSPAPSATPDASNQSRLAQERAREWDR